MHGVTTASSFGRPHGDWTGETLRLLGIKLICAGCYNQARIRNTHTEATLDESGRSALEVRKLRLMARRTSARLLLWPGL
jgi:hypothetical protein